MQEGQVTGLHIIKIYKKLDIKSSNRVQKQRNNMERSSQKSSSQDCIKQLNSYNVGLDCIINKTLYLLMALSLSCSLCWQMLPIKHENWLNVVRQQHIYKFHTIVNIPERKHTNSKQTLCN
jgi:hypothetical protein